MNVAEQLTSLRGKLLEREPMARYTSWRVGGAAERFFEPVDREDLLMFIAGLPEHEPVLFVGLGSNLLVRDGGLKGTVIRLHGCLDALRIEQRNDDSCVVYAQAGVSSAQLARFAAKQGLAGGEFFAGIPGTVGGALAMNAGAFGGETWQFVDGVETVDRKAQLHVRRPQEFTVDYRKVVRPNDEWFIAGYFRFQTDPAATDKKRIRELLHQRGATQPIGVYSCGSVFRNPPGNYAAKLIESCGLKGYRIGGAQVSEKHANFIINEKNASASDLEQLILYVQRVVEEQTAVRLQTEVAIVGEPL